MSLANKSKKEIQALADLANDLIGDPKHGRKFRKLLEFVAPKPGASATIDEIYKYFKKSGFVKSKDDFMELVIWADGHDFVCTSSGLKRAYRARKMGLT